MNFPFVSSYTQGGTARGPRLAVVWHMAEGGGTVGYLSRQNRHGVSVHFVVEYTGRIVRMLRLDQMHTSIRTSAIRTTDDADGFYGATAARAAMHEWANIHRTLGPNHASIGVEIEGFAKDGPNAKQAAAIASLYDYLNGQYPGIRSLGHRDFADYKACPGKQFPWAAVGGHASPAPEDDMPGLEVTLVGDKAISGVFRSKVATQAIYLHDRTQRDDIAAGRAFQALGTYARDFDGAEGYVLTESRKPSWVSKTAGTFTPDAPAAATDCKKAIDDAIAADRARARITYS